MRNSQIQKQEKILEIDRKKRIIEDNDKARDAQRNMAWFSLFSMLLYPFLVVISIFFNLDKAGKILGDMAPTFFVSVAAIVAAFYGKEAFEKK